MTDWMTLRVVLLGRRGEPLARPPGRLLLMHSDHSFADLSEAVDVAFGRWDLSPPHEFTVEGRRLVSGGVDDDAEDSDDVTVGEVGLRLGTPFTYVFDVGEGWTHECRVESVDVDPVDEYGEVPQAPVPLYGWGTIPDQYGRLTEDDEDIEVLDTELTGEAEPGTAAEEPAADDRPDEQAVAQPPWTRAEGSAWGVVAEALAGFERRRDDAALRAVVGGLRRLPDNEEWPYDVLFAAGGLDDDEPPEDDEELWLTLAAGVVEPRGALPLDPDAESAWAALEPADWAGAVIELVRAGVGQPADPETLLGLIDRCPEVEGADLTPEDEEILLAGLDTVVQLWTALGVLDGSGALTPLGRWGLPESLRTAWKA
ncbi:MAG TPA: hypothetical protein VM324_07755 [Egibacteraceae bacterium]|nr:hypothetical protein [Egibacteraceae bacterium]